MKIKKELGAFLWDRLETAENEEELLTAVLDEYEVTKETAKKDLRTFLDKLREMGIL